MSGNELDAVCDEDKMIAYIYEDVDDSDIFATEPLLNNSFADCDPKSDSDPGISQPEISQQHEELNILVEKLQKEKETLLLRISELHKTAKAEFERKNTRIKDLEKEKDNILFRRGNNIFRSKPPDAETRVPVLQQVETNEDFQNFNTRYRIPKKKCDINEINEIGTEILKEDLDKHSNDRSRPRETLNLRNSKENRTIRSPNNKHRSSIEEYEQKNVQKRSKSFSRYRVLSPENHVKQPRSPSRERSQERNNIYQLKTLDGDIEPEHRRIHSNLTSRSRKSRSPSNEHIFKFNENSIIKKSIPNRSKSESRLKPHAPEYRIRQPRTPSEESSRSNSRNRDTKSRKSRARSRVRSRVNCRPISKESEHFSTGTNKSGLMGEDIKPRYNIEHSRQVNRIRSSDRNKCNRNKSEDNEVRSSRSNEGKIRRGDNRDKSSQRQDKRLLQSSSRADARKYSERSDAKDGGARDIKPHFDLREKCRRRSNSYARERDSSGHSGKQDNRRSGRNERRFHRDRSRSSSVERTGKRRFRHNAESLLDRHGNVINYKYRNRSRSSSREKPLNYNIQELQTRDSKSRQRHIGRLKEKLLRHSLDRDRALKEDKHPDKKNVYINNDIDCSDLDDIKLHLSGDSDIDTFNMQNAMEHRDEQLNSNDADFELLKNLPDVDYENMTVDQIERLLQEKKDEYNQVSSDAHRKDIFNQEENFNAKFRDCKKKLTDNEDDNGGQIERNFKRFMPLIDVEELDYEPNPSRHRQSVKHCQEEIIEHINSEQSNYSSINFRIGQQNKALPEDTMEMHEKIIDVQQSTNSAECQSKSNITIYGARQQQKKRDENYKKGTKSSQIIRTNIQLSRSEVANSIQETKSFGFKKKPQNQTNTMCDSERIYQSQSMEIKRENCVLENKGSMHEANEERNGNGQGINKERTQYSYNDLIKYIQTTKQECTSTRDEICNTRSKVTKAVLDKKRISENAIDKLEDEQETNENENQFKTAKVEEKEVATKKKEKITLHAYKSRKQSTSEVDIKDVNYGTVPKDNEIATNIPTKNVGEITSTILSNNEKRFIEQATLSSNRLPEMEDGSIQENGENKLVTNPLINEGEKCVQTAEKTVNIIGNKEESFHKAPKQNESNIPVENLLVDVITDDIPNRAVNYPETYIYKDPNNFLHDFSISDDDDNANNEEPDQEVRFPEEGKKINIISQVTISPSYTPPPPYPKNFGDVSEIWENVSKDGKVEFKETRVKNSRKSLFKDFQFTNETEQGVADIQRNEKQMNHDSGCNSPALPGAVENIPPVDDITSRRTINPRLRDSSECIDEIQQAVKNMVEDTFEHISLSTASNVVTEKLDTEELQKCLEEDIITPNGEKLGNNDTGPKKEIEGQVRMTKIVKNKNSSKETKDEHVDETQKTGQNREINNGDKLKKKLIDSRSGDKITKLFGPMTPSPCQAMRKISKESVNKNKVKRNIAQCEQINDNHDFKIRDKTHKMNKKVRDKKVIDKNDRNAETRGIRNRSKTAVESKQVVMIIPPEDVKKCKELNEAVEETTKKAFCSNPTYLFNSRDTLTKVFESPNHYIQKKNQEARELKEKITRNLNKDLVSKTKCEEKSFPESIAIDDHRLMENTSIGEGNAEAKKLEETKPIKRPKHQKHKGKRKTICDEESSEEEEAKHNKPKAKAKRGQKNLDSENTEENENLPLTSKQSKKNLTQSSSNDEKKTRNPSFKIKIKRPKSVAKKKIRNKKRSLLDTDKDSFEEPADKIYQKERTVKEKMLSSDVANVTNKKRKVKENECIQDLNVPEDQSLSNSRLDHIRNLVETESRKVSINKKEQKPKLKGIKLKRTVRAQNKERNENYQEEIKAEQTCKKLKNGQDDNYTNSEEVKERSEVMKATETSSKEKMENKEQILDINNINTKRKDASFEVKSVSNNTSTNECVTEPVKTIKRITPQRIDNSSLMTEKERKFKELQAKRELFIENSESININNKRERLSSSGDDCRPEVKRSKISLTESIVTTEEDFIDNGAHTQIKISESKANLEVVLLSTTTTEQYIINNDSQMKVPDTKVDKEVTPLVGPHASPLYNIEQTFDTLSRRCENATKSDSRLVNAANSQLQPQHEGADDTFSGIQLDTIPCDFGSISQLSIFSMSNKSIPLVGEIRSKSDDIGDNNIKSDKISLSFMNLLEIDSKTSTPIKNRGTAVKLDNYISKDASGCAADNKAEVHVARTDDNPDIYSSVITSSNNQDLQKSVPGGSNSNAVLSAVCSKPNMNISDYRTSLGMTSNVPIGNCVSRVHVKFSRTLKRDRRRPITMIVMD